MNQTANDTAILNADDPTVSSWRSGLEARVLSFSVKTEVNDGIFLRGNMLILREGNEERALVDVTEMKLRGTHNAENVAAALAAGIACGVKVDSMRETVKAFDPVEHRLEFVDEIQKIRFYNDSKATSVDATLKALEAFATDAGKVVLILGGRGKKAPYAPLAELVRIKVRSLILIGEDAETIASELGDLAPMERASDMKDAVNRSFIAAKPGDTVLLAPACASFDMFDSFEHRGKVFKSEVSELKGRSAEN
jgi:UDP-N-acetylmuramoylalanine--D-glutamate ligase